MPTKGEVPDPGEGPDPSKNRCTEMGRNGRCRNATVPSLKKCHMHIESVDTGDDPDDAGDESAITEDVPIWERQRSELLGAPTL